MAILGVDVGGTFTDAALLTEEGELRTAKVPTAGNQAESVLAASSGSRTGRRSRRMRC
jgi:N-methylhydantoinase A/oxoprolinase/acetone carboxylase beta subunit